MSSEKAAVVVMTPALISETTTSPSTPPSYKYAVNSTIIQHLLPNPKPSQSVATSTDPKSEQSQPTSSTSEGETTVAKSEPGVKVEPGSASQGQGQPVAKGVGRRGMHSATGAYWNNEKDGMWSFKYEEAAGRGMDVVVSVIWIAI
ncbi:MAG: hypothetical protein M1840_006129 [Geoglossum simile]|nr:MAG: hypothetical protein M1840_006129 [Geoglossum simile]